MKQIQLTNMFFGSQKLFCVQRIFLYLSLFLFLSCASQKFAYRVGEKIGLDVEFTVVETKVSGDGSRHGRKSYEYSSYSLFSWLSQKKKLTCLIFIGGATGPEGEAQLWCNDTEQELGLYQKLFERYFDKAIDFYFVACPPVYGDSGFGDARKIFLDSPDGDEEYLLASRQFLWRTRSYLEAKNEHFRLLYDFRFRGLLNRKKPLPKADPVKSWYGRFKADGDHQNYGTPTIWLISPEGVVLAPPFFGNNYPDKLRYSLEDVCRAIDEALLITVQH